MKALKWVAGILVGLAVAPLIFGMLAWLAMSYGMYVRLILVALGVVA